MLSIDGSILEGGGQIVRTALALSVLTGTPFRVHNIRRNRPRPGLKNQHLRCIEALQQLSAARVDGARPGSDTVTFVPGPVKARSLSLDVGTAGSVTLLLQSLLLPAAFADADLRIRIIGGTDVRWSMPVDYLAQVIVPHFQRLAGIAVQTLRRGFYPKGQGMVEVRVRPRFRPVAASGFDAWLEGLRAAVPAVRLEVPPPIAEIRGVSAAAEALQRADVCRRQAAAAQRRLGDGLPATIREAYGPCACPGTVITLWAHSHSGTAGIGADALGERGVQAETVGESAADRLLARIASGAAADHHLADNLVPLLALLGGAVTVDRITDHIRSNIHVCEQFLKVRFSVDAAGGRNAADPL